MRTLTIQHLIVISLFIISNIVSSAEMLNMSTKSFVGLEEQRQVAGFVVTGEGAIKVLIKAEGASLADVLTNPLNDPILTLKNVFTGEIIQVNDNWQDNDNVDEIIATGSAPSDPKDPAMIVELSAGSWTAMVAGVNNTTGIAQVSAKKLSQVGSFSPFVVPQTDGTEKDVKSLYLINGGQAFTAELHNTKRTITPKGYLSITTNVEKQTQDIHYQAQLDGNAGDETIGQISFSFTQHFTTNTFPETLRIINRRDFSLDEWYGNYHEFAPIQAIVWQRKDRGTISLSTTTVAWIPDRYNFDDETLYPIDSTHIGIYNFGGSFNYDLNRRTETWVNNDYNQQVIDDNLNIVSEMWTIIGHQHQMTVLDTVYDNIVIAEREYSPSLLGDETMQKATYWFAQGVGVIRSVGEYYIGDKPLTLELAETNLK